MTVSDGTKLRILAISETWSGANSYAFVTALGRAGHEVKLVADEGYGAPGWRHPALRASRRLLRPLIARDMSRAIMHQLKMFAPHLLLVYKGVFVTPEVLRTARNLGTVSVNIWPDVSTMTHGPWPPRSLPHYDWVFTTKAFGLEDMKRLHGVTNASMLPHGYDPAVHHVPQLSAIDRLRFSCDISFIGTWSPKKEELLLAVHHAMPGCDLRIWGSQWNRANSLLHAYIQDSAIYGLDYARAIHASRINLGLLSEARPGASSGDRLTSRSFHIPACGGFMLHERTSELSHYFLEGEECACFSDGDELAAKIALYLNMPRQRHQIASAGHQRCQTSDYSIDDRAKVVIEKLHELRDAEL